jgi:DNA recombination protein RmuC
MKSILSPLQEKIIYSKKKSKIRTKKASTTMQLCQQILGLREMNVQMSKETINLTRALKGDSKMQGMGELVLKSFRKNQV